MRALVLVAAVVSCAVAVVAWPAQRSEPSFRPALPAIAEATKAHPVVLVGELHGWPAAHRFFRRLVADLAARGAIDDVVVEFGNARFQPLVDRYVAGAPIPEARVRRAWLETTQGSVWATPDYAAFFRAIRALNRTLPRENRLRVLLGDPPYDPRSDIDADLFQRDAHFAHVIQSHVVARGRRAIAIAGLGHVLRQPPPHPTLANLLEGRVPCEPDPLAVAAGVNACDDLEPYAPVQAYVVVPHVSGAGDELPPQAERPSLAVVAGTSLGGRALAGVLGDDPADEGAAWTLEQAADAYLVLEE